MYAIIGLGNPGKRYTHTRHNVGFWAVSELYSRFGKGAAWEERGGSQFTKVAINQHTALLIQPLKYMNRSGEASAPLLGFYKIPLDRVVALYDEIDLGVGALRVRLGGSTGGHRGATDLVTHLGGDGFYRVRIGVGRPPPGGMDPADWVLAAPSPEDRKLLEETVKSAADAVCLLMDQGLEAVQQKFNRK